MYTAHTPLFFPQDFHMGQVPQVFAEIGNEAQNCFELQNQQTTVDI